MTINIEGVSMNGPIPPEETIAPAIIPSVPTKPIKDAISIFYSSLNIKNMILGINSARMRPKSKKFKKNIKVIICVEYSLVNLLN